MVRMPCPLELAPHAFKPYPSSSEESTKLADGGGAYDGSALRLPVALDNGAGAGGWSSDSSSESLDSSSDSSLESLDDVSASEDSREAAAAAAAFAAFLAAFSASSFSIFSR